jgi:hypothetical protein
MQITLPAIAFGGSASVRELPQADGAWSRWLRAVALGGQGFYAAAAVELRRIEVGGGPAVLRSLAASTRAAHLRQGGRHHRAADQDGIALHIVGPADLGDARSSTAVCDALTGLAADDLGRGMYSAADRLLGRVEQILDDRDLVPGDDDEDWIWGPRPELRWRWVRAELAMYTADPAAASEHAAAAEEIALAGPSSRHRIKTDLICAAAAAAGGDLAVAGDRAMRVVDAAAVARQPPLEWAAAKLLEGIGAGEHWAGRAERLGCLLAERGGEMGRRDRRDADG